MSLCVYITFWLKMLLKPIHFHQQQFSIRYIFLPRKFVWCGCCCWYCCCCYDSIRFNRTILFQGIFFTRLFTYKYIYCFQSPYITYHLNEPQFNSLYTVNLFVVVPFYVLNIPCSQFSTIYYLFFFLAVVSCLFSLISLINVARTRNNFEISRNDDFGKKTGKKEAEKKRSMICFEFINLNMVLKIWIYLVVMVLFWFSIQTKDEKIINEKVKRIYFEWNTDTTE